MDFMQNIHILPMRPKKRCLFPKGDGTPEAIGASEEKTDGKRLLCRSIRCPQTVRKMGEVSNFYVFSLKVQRLSIDNPESELYNKRNILEKRGGHNGFCRI